jgi:hypothetical protein
VELAYDGLDELCAVADVVNKPEAVEKILIEVEEAFV